MDKKVTYSEQELVSLLKKRDNPSFNYLYSNYASSLYYIVLQFIADKDVAEEVLQEVFVKIWRNIESYDESKGKLFTWMLHIGRNLCIDTLRSKAYQNGQKNCGLSGHLPIETSSRSFYVKVDNIGMKEVLGKLAPKYRVLIELAFFKGYTYEEIAESEGIPLGTVKSRIRTALLQLRAYFLQYDVCS